MAADPVWKYLNARIQHKHDTATQWGLKPNFIPEAGELIVYDADSTHNARFKIGDGQTKVGELPFITGVTSVNGQTGDVSLTIPTVPSNVSSFANDVGYLTSLPYGECDTAAATQAKAVTVTPAVTLTEGQMILVKFTYAQTYNGAPTLNVNGLGAKNIKRIGTTNAARYEWLAGEVIEFVYDGSYWMMVDGGIATTTYNGATKLATSATSTSTALSLTPASLNSLAQNMLAGAPAYSASATYAVGDRVRYSYQIWECVTAITTAEAWTAAHWKELPSLQEQIDSAVSSIPDVTDTEDLSGDGFLTEEGYYFATQGYEGRYVTETPTTAQMLALDSQVQSVVLGQMPTRVS